MRTRSIVAALCALASSCARPSTNAKGPSAAAQPAEAATPAKTPKLEPDELQRRVAAIEAELTRLATGHPWAGSYHGGAGDTGTTLSLAPNSGFALIANGAGGKRVLACGKVHLDSGRITLEPEHLQDPARVPALAYVCARWGERRYLLPAREHYIVGFCNRFNSGQETAEPNSSPWFATSSAAPASGVPQLPAPYDRWVFEKPLVAHAVSFHLKAPDGVRIGRVWRVVLDVGTQDGVFVGMSLYRGEEPRYLDVDEVHEKTCVADWGDTPVVVGTEFSTRSTRYR